ncbi:MAG: hypothetical protein KC910_08580 [Candidatus Eremiobacteraeota bacterium]|nr:hypothetical protein [Candidatus Eremiobacteraeota bacterium]
MTKRLALLAVTLAVVVGLAGPGQSQSHEWSLQDSGHPRPQTNLQGRSLFPAPFDKLVPFLGGLGGDIDQGRAHGDVDALLEAAVTLHQAELLLGRSSGVISAHDLLTEATQMAVDQRNLEGLRKAKSLWSDPVRGPNDPAQAQQAADELENLEKERRVMLAARRCQIIFHNQTDVDLTIRLNQDSLGIIKPNQVHVVKDVLAGNQHLMASDSRLAWGPRRVFVGPGEVFHWRLFD